MAVCDFFHASKTLGSLRLLHEQPFGGDNGFECWWRVAILKRNQDLPGLQNLEGLTLEKKIEKIRFTFAKPGADRVYHVTPEQIKVVLSRLPYELWRMLRDVHFNDRSRGARMLGYVTSGRREISVAALPPRMSFTRFLVKGQAPEHFGAVRGAQWPELAIQRFMLYDVFLHELGHLQVIDEKAKSVWGKYAREGKAEEFAMYWYRTLWREPFDHPDPVHNKPSKQEIAEVKARLGVQG